ncbi:hypothetical protein, partial [Streptomyces odonnellii]|uniref:hypothetical protein n=1 Tax=Streptomyces odonnellii TaxID=1417980 RepID=UPI0012FF2402
MDGQDRKHPRGARRAVRTRIALGAAVALVGVNTLTVSGVAQAVAVSAPAPARTPVSAPAFQQVP